MIYTFNDTIVILNYLEYIFYQLSTFTKSELSCRKILLSLSFQRLLTTWSDFAQEITYLNSCLVYYSIFVCLFVYYFKSSWRDIFQSFSFSGYTGLAQKFLWDFSSIRCYRKTQMNFLANQIHLLSGSYKMLSSDLNLFFPVFSQDWTLHRDKSSSWRLFHDCQFFLFSKASYRTHKCDSLYLTPSTEEIYIKVELYSSGDLSGTERMKSTRKKLSQDP